jgi:tetratricopeptide (TPR) repeat protein
VNLAYGQLQLGHMKEALKECDLAKEMADRADVRAQALAMYNLASMQLHLNMYEEAIPMSLQARKLAQQAGVKLWEGNSLLNLGTAYFNLGRYEEAKSTLTEALKVLSQTQDKLGITRSIYDLALTAGQIGDFQDAVKQMESALPMIKALDIRHSHEIEMDEMAYYNYIEENSLRLLADWQNKLGHVDQAKAYSAALDDLLKTRPAAMGAHQHKWVG